MGIKELIASDLYNRLHNTFDNIKDEQTAIVAIKDFIKSYATILNIGKQEIVSHLPQNIFSTKMNDSYMTLYKSENYNKSTCIKTEFTTFYRQDTITLITYPSKDDFTDEQKEVIAHVGNILYQYYSKFIYLKYIENANLIDNLTSSPNMLGMISMAEELVKNKGTLEGYAVLFINLRSMKLINNEVGTKNGDVILTKYFLNLEHFFIDKEFFGRLGGDNFGALIKQERIEIFLSKLNQVQLSVITDDIQHTFTLASRVGIYILQKDDDFTTGLQRASVANAICKTLKKSDVFYYTEDIKNQIDVEQQIVFNFETALKEEEFCVFYQPKVDIKTNRLIGAEALVRWYKDGNIIPPLNFIPILEKQGIIHELDLYIFEHVCRDIREWLKSGVEPVKVSVNFSRNNLQDENLFEKIENTCQKYNISNKYLEVEITESSMYENPIMLSSFINKLNEHHISVSVDDFGTGYSSLNFIKDYPFDIVKIDKSFVDSIDRDNIKNSLFLQNIVKLLKDLDMKIVAEGVEEKYQLEYLKEIGCDIIQGYIFDRPLSKTDFKTRLIHKKYNEDI